MTFGPNYIYQCPHCNKYISRGSIASGNTIGMKIYSDGKRIAPMLMEFPKYTKCKKCKSILNLDKMVEVAKYWHDNEIRNEWANADKAEFLTVYEYFNALSSGVAQDESEEMDIRFDIWWSFNDRVRASEPLFQNDVDKYLWQENLIKLIDLLFITPTGNALTLAEIHRCLGKFDLCMNNISILESDELGFIKEIYFRECNAGNTLVFQLV